MRKSIAYPLTAALLVLGGCSKLDNPDKPDAMACDLCHTTPLDQFAVHRLHLSNLAMANFPYRNTSPDFNYPVDTSQGDSTYKVEVDTAFRFSQSATLDQAMRYQQNRLLNEGIQCVDCHRGLDGSLVQNNDPNHRNGREDADFDTVALLEKHYDAVDTAHFLATAPSMSFDGTTCNNMVCHGAGRKSLQNVVWNTAPKLTDTMSCLGCHNTTNHKIGVSCDKCHYDVTLDGGQTIHNFRKHWNDTIYYGRY